MLQTVLEDANTAPTTGFFNCREPQKAIVLAVAAMIIIVDGVRDSPDTAWFAIICSRRA